MSLSKELHHRTTQSAMCIILRLSSLSGQASGNATEWKAIGTTVVYMIISREGMHTALLSIYSMEIPRCAISPRCEADAIDPFAHAARALPAKNVQRCCSEFSDKKIKRVLPA